MIKIFKKISKINFKKKKNFLSTVNTLLICMREVNMPGNLEWLCFLDLVLIDEFCFSY